MPPLESDPEPETTEEKPDQNRHDGVAEIVNDVVEEEKDELPRQRIEEEKSEYSSISDSEGYNPHALYCICRQRHNKRFMISCDSCQEWFHGDCVGVSETQGRKLERSGRDWICPNCPNDSQRQPGPVPSQPECLTLPSSGQEMGVHEEQASEEAVVQEVPEVVAVKKTESSLPQCIGPGCSKHALPDSVYCGTDCILQHAAVTMKTLSDSKEAKTKPRPQKKAAAKSVPKGQRSARILQKESMEHPEEEQGDEEKDTKAVEEDMGADSSTPPSPCASSLTAVQAASVESSMLNQSKKKDSEPVEVEIEPTTHSDSASVNITEFSPLGGSPANNDNVSKKLSEDKSLAKASNPHKSGPFLTSETLNTSVPRHHETGALRISKTSFTIPKKQPDAPITPTPPSPSPPVPLNETRNLPVSPAPIAPSSRPPQPANHQVRQSIQRSLTNILYKRVCDCEDLEKSESEVGKLVTNIETEMFTIFNNTDSKYMNKYRTIMFNLKDPKNMGLLYSVIRGEVSPFRLARMSQRDMQATKVSEPSKKDTPEVSESGPKAPCVLRNPAPEPVKVDLPSLPSRANRHMEQKSPLPAATKARPSQSNQSSTVPDILSCMLKDTTAEHRAHLFDLKCKICTGQMSVEDDEEPAPKKSKLSASSSSSIKPDQWRDMPSRPPWMYARTDPRTEDRGWRTAAGDESPLLAPPDSPTMDSPASPVMEDDSALVIMETPISPTTESPASPPMESPTSPILESPASPVMDSPSSPKPENCKAKTASRVYTPVMIPAVSTVTITRRDPRTPANRSLPGDPRTAGIRTPVKSSVTTSAAQPPPVSYAPPKHTVTLSKPSMPLPPPPSLPPPPYLPPPPALPKYILMKPSSSSFYGSSGSSASSSRAVNSHSPPDGETAQFLAKQEVVWKGFLNMVSVSKFVTKGYLISGSSEYLKEDLPDTIQIGGRIMPQTVWDYIGRMKTSFTKELCVIRFHPATDEEEVAYVSLFSYFSSRRRFGVVANNSRSIKDIYLIPLSAKEAIPLKLQPFEGSGFEKNRPNLLLGLVICQKLKRVGNLPQEMEEKRVKMHMSKDPRDTGLPRPPTLYGSDPRMEEFLPYDPAMPIMSTPPGSPSGSPSDSSGSFTVPSLLSSIKAAPPTAAPPSITSSDTAPSSTPATPLQTILKSLFGKDSPAVPAVAVPPPSTLPPPPMVDPIVQQYGQKSKVKQFEEEENEFDRPYDPEEEYDTAIGYGMVAPISVDTMLKAKASAQATCAEDDVAYDPEDDTIFEDIHKGNRVSGTKALIPVPILDPTPAHTPVPSPAQATVLAPTPASAPLNLPSTGAVIVSAATLTEQQRMLEDLNRQIEEQKKQLKEQEEALRQQREAVGMFMAHFSVSDALMSPPPKSGVSQFQTQHAGGELSEANSLASQRALKGLLKIEEKEVPIKQDINGERKTGPLSESIDGAMPEGSPKHVNDIKKETDNSDPEAGEIQDSDVAYDPEDDTMFDELQDRNGERMKNSTRSDSARRSERSRDSSVSSSCRGTSRNDTSDRRRKRSSQPDTHSPKRRDRKLKDRHESPSRKSGRRSPGRSDRRRDRHRRGERSRPYHRDRDSERSVRHLPHKERASRRSSGIRKRSPSTPRKKRDYATKGHSKGQWENSNTVSEDSKGSEAIEDIVAATPAPELGMEANDSPQPPQTIDETQSDHSESGGPQQEKDDDTHHQISCANPTPLQPGVEQSTQGLLGSPPTGLNNPQDPNIQLEDNKDWSTQQEILSQSCVQSPSDIMREKQFSTQGLSHISTPSHQAERFISSDIREGRRNPGLDIRATEISGSGTDTRGEGQAPGPDIMDERRALQIKHPGPNIKAPESDSPDLRGDHCSLTNSGGQRSPSPHFSSPRMLLSFPRANGPRGLSASRFNQPRGSSPGHFPDKLAPPRSRFSGLHDQPVARLQGLLGTVGGANNHHDSEGGETMDQHIVQSPSDIMREKQFSTQGPCYVATPNNHNERPVGLERGDTDMSEGRRNSGLDIRGREMRGERRVPEPDFRGPEPANRGSGLRPDIRRPGPDMMCPGPDMQGPGPDVRDRRPDIRGPGPEMWGRGPDTKGPDTEIWDDRRGQRPDMRGPGPEMRGHGPEIWDDRRGPGPDMRGPMSDRMGPGLVMMGPGTEMRHDRRGPGQDVSGPGTELWDDKRGPGPDRRGPGPDRRGPGPDRRGPGPDRRGPGTDMGGPGPDMRGPRPHMRGPGPDMRGPGPDMQGPGPDMRGPGPDMRGPGPDMRGSGPDMWGPEPDMQGPGPEMWDDRSGPVSDIRGPGPDMRGPEPKIWDDRSGPGPDMRGPGPDMRGPGSDMRGPGPIMRSPGPDMRGPGPDRRGPGPDRRFPGLDRRGPGPDMRGPEMWEDRRGSGPDRRGPGPDRRGPGPDTRGPGTDIWDNRRCPGPDMRSPDMRKERRHPDMRDTGHDIGSENMNISDMKDLEMSGPDPDMSCLDMAGDHFTQTAYIGRHQSPTANVNSMRMSTPFDDQSGAQHPGFHGSRGPRPSKFNQLRGLSPGNFADNMGQPRFRFDGPQSVGTPAHALLLKSREHVIQSLSHNPKESHIPSQGPLHMASPNRRGERSNSLERRESEIMEGMRNTGLDEIGPDSTGPDEGDKNRGPDPVIRGNRSRPNMRDPGLNVTGNRRGPGPDARSPGLARRGPGQDTRDDGRGPVPDTKDPEQNIKGSVQDTRGDRRRPGQDTGLGSQGPGTRGDRKGSDTIDPEPNIRGPGPDTRDDRRGSGPEMRGPGQDNRGPGPDTRGDRRGPGPNRGPGPDTRGDRKGPGPDSIDPETNMRRPDIRGDRSRPGSDTRGDRGPGQGPDTIGERRGPGQDTRDAEPNIIGPGLDKKEDRKESGPDIRSPGSDNRGLDTRGDRRGPIRDTSVPRSELRGPDLGPDKRCDKKGPDPRLNRRGPDLGPDMNGPRPDLRGLDLGEDTKGGRRETNRGGPESDMGDPGPVHRRTILGPDTRSDRRGQGPDTREAGPDVRGLGPDRRVDRRGPGADMKGDRRGQGPDMREPGPDMGGPGPDIRGDRRGPGPDMRDPASNNRGPGLEPATRGDRRGPNMGGPGPDIRGQGPGTRGDRRVLGPDPSGRASENRGSGLGPDTRSDMRGQGPDMREAGPDMRGPEPDQRGGWRRPGPDMWGPWTDNRGPGLGPDTMVERRDQGPDMRELGSDMRGPGPDPRGDWGVPENRGAGVGPELGGDRRGHRQDMREPGSDIRGPGPDTRGVWRGPDKRGPNNRGPGLEPNLRGCGGGLEEDMWDDWRGPGSDTRSDRTGPGPDIRNDWRGPGPDTKGDRRGAGPDTWDDRGGSGPELRGPRPDIWDESIGLELRGPGRDMRGPGLDNRGPGLGPDTMVNRRRPGQNMRDSGPDTRGHRRGPVPNMWDERRVPGPDIRDDKRGPGPDMREDRRAPGPDIWDESRGSDMIDPEPDMWDDRRGPGSDMWGPEPGTGGPGTEMRGPGLDMWDDRRGPGPDRSGPGPDRRGPGPDRRDPGPDRRGPGPDRRCPGPDRRGPGPDMRGPGPDMRGPGPDMRGPGPDMRGPRPDMRGPSPEMRGPGPGMRGPGPDMTGLAPEMQSSDPHIGQSIRGDHFTSNTFVGPRGVYSPRFQGLRGPRPLRSNQLRGSSSGHCANRGQPRFDSPLTGVRPLRHKAGLLPTPPEGLICLPNNSPDAFREDQWQNSHSPEIRRASLPREDCERSHSEDRDHCNNPRNRGNFQDSAPYLFQERLLPDIRRDRDRSHGRLWDRGTGRPVSRSREAVGGRELKRPREVEGEKQKTSTEKDKDMSRATVGPGDANKDPSLHKRSLSKDSDRDRLKDESGKKVDTMGGNVDMVDSNDAPQTDTPQESKGPV